MKIRTFFVILSFFLIALIDIITSVIGLNFYGLKESNINAFPMFYSLFACGLWLILEKHIFQKYNYFSYIIFPLWCLILSLPSINNLVLILNATGI